MEMLLKSFYRKNGMGKKARKRQNHKKLFMLKKHTGIYQLLALQ